MTGLVSQDRAGLPSASFMQGSHSVMSEEDNGQVAILWGTNIDVNEVENKIRKFVRGYIVKCLLQR